MIVKKLSEVPFADLSGYQNVEKQVVIGPEDGSNEIIMRYFTLNTGGSSPYHVHPWPHLVRVEKGTGVLVDIDGNTKPLEAGNFVYVPDNEKHQFRNTGDGDFCFICIVPERGES